MNELANLNTTNFAELALLAGMGTPYAETKTSSLMRLALQHKPISAKQDIKGKKVNVEVVEAGSFRIEEPIADGKKIYSSNVTIRPFMQRVFYKRFIMGDGDKPNRFRKTVMANDLKSELKDTDGGFNCGKPNQYFEDWNQVPDNVKSVIRATKRTRAIFGTLTVKDAVDAEGNPVSTPDPFPAIWEVNNNEAYTSVNAPFNKLYKMQQLPMSYNIVLSTEEKPLPNGDSFYLPRVALDLKNKIDLLDSDQDTFTNFLDWIKDHNSYVLSKWDENNVDDVDDTTKDLVDEFIDVASEEAA
tara:strand:- start:3652 stop:4551 length:900 start_codon:yes stop_codon:yes gene_type:complete